MEKFIIFFKAIYFLLSCLTIYVSFLGGEMYVISTYLGWLLNPLFLLIMALFVKLIPSIPISNNFLTIFNIVLGYIFWFKVIPIIFKIIKRKIIK